MTKVNPNFGDVVVAWQKKHGRHDLPWQNTQDPYVVWLSEVMLQQTQVATVREYFARFMQRFPRVADLASAHHDEVMGLWSGLGYYSRARNLHRAAQEIIALHDGVFPSTAQALQTLPGIGRSTAAAVASLCFGEPIAILDGNVKRVLTRYLGFAADLSIASSEKELWAIAQTLLPQKNIKSSMPHYTQGIMDLGATVCTPKKPVCGICPLVDSCQAFAANEVERYPVKTRKIKRSSTQLWLLQTQTLSGDVWLEQRPQSGVWAGLYCLPLFDSYEELKKALPEKFKNQLSEKPVFKHVLTHKDFHMHPVVLLLPTKSSAINFVSEEGRWVSAAQWPQLGLPAPIRKLLEHQAN